MTMRSLNELMNNEEGATAVEYGLIAALLSVVVIAALAVIGGQLNNSYSKVGSAVTKANR